MIRIGSISERAFYYYIKVPTHLSLIEIQCIISHIERNCARELQEKLISYGLMKPNNIIKEIDYLDPLCNFMSGV